MLDTVILGGLLVDGTGNPQFRADIGIKDGRIVRIGTDIEEGARTIDADGMVVTPGFIDVHTHYDAQVMWDPGVTPSSLHGVTTVIGGNCGFTIAPVSDESRDYVMQMLASVEGMPVESLRVSLDWTWHSFSDWLAQLDGRLAINTGFSVGHSTVRRLVMGDDFRRPATDAEIRQMERHVDASLEAGAIGFSSSWGEAHSDHLGCPVPSRFAESAELIRLSARLQGYPGTMLEFIPTVEHIFPDDAIELMADMSAAAGRPLNWNVLSVGGGADGAAIERRLSSADRAAAKGGKVVALTMPMPSEMRLNLRSTIAFNWLPVWPDVLALEFDECVAALVDPSTRAQLAAAIVGKESRTFLNFAPMAIDSVNDRSLQSLVGRTVGDVATERGCTPLDAFLDIAVEDDLNACFTTPPGGTDAASWGERASIWKDPRTLVGASDAGAHLDMIATFGYFTDLVGPSVRDRNLLSLEDAVHLITDAPARLYGLRDRGRIAEGWMADIAVFDPDTVGCGNVTMRTDMPGGYSRLYSEPRGIAHLFVNGDEVLTDGELTNARPGTVLRNGRDTE
jgi:N-acyl-D-aspartate/D-glutamate deacylase